MILLSTTKLSMYRAYLHASLLLRARGDEQEDAILDRLDSLWYELSENEKAAANAFASFLSRNCLDEAGNVVAEEPSDIWADAMLQPMLNQNTAFNASEMSPRTRSIAPRTSTVTEYASAA